MKPKRLKRSMPSDESLLVNVARTIGSALGSVAAEAGKLASSAAAPARSRGSKTRPRVNRMKTKVNVKTKAKSRRPRAARNA